MASSLAAAGDGLGTGMEPARRGNGREPTTGVPGVCLHRGKFQAQVSSSVGKFNLGEYALLSDASAAVNTAVGILRANGARCRVPPQPCAGGPTLHVYAKVVALMRTRFGRAGVTAPIFPAPPQPQASSPASPASPLDFLASLCPEPQPSMTRGKPQRAPRDPRVGSANFVVALREQLNPVGAGFMDVIAALEAGRSRHRVLGPRICTTPLVATTWRLVTRYRASTERALRVIARAMLPMMPADRAQELSRLGMPHRVGDEASWSRNASAAVIRAIVADRAAAARVPEHVPYAHLRRRRGLTPRGAE
jgi:hypothetical protein